MRPRRVIIEIEIDASEAVRVLRDGVALLTIAVDEAVLAQALDEQDDER